LPGPFLFVCGPRDRLMLTVAVGPSARRARHDSSRLASEKKIPFASLLHRDPGNPSETRARPRLIAPCTRRDESKYRRTESLNRHLLSCIVAPTWHYRWWVGRGGTPRISAWPKLADFRRPYHMGSENCFVRPKICAPTDRIDARLGLRPESNKTGTYALRRMGNRGRTRWIFARQNGWRRATWRRWN